jgi:hypothetical protein
MQSSAHLVMSAVFLPTLALPSDKSPYPTVPLATQGVPRDLRRMVHFTTKWPDARRGVLCCYE